MITTLILTSLFIMLSYIAVMIKREGIPYSVSATYYSLKNKFWFSFTMISFSIFLLPALLEKTPEQYQYLAFLSIVGMLMVGIAPNFKNKHDKIERVLHYVGAIMAIVFSQLWILCLNPLFLLVWAVYILYTICGVKRNWSGKIWSDFISTKPMFWVEITALSPIFPILLIN